MTPDLTFNRMVQKVLALEASKLDTVKISNSRISNGCDINYVSGQITGAKHRRLFKPLEGSR
jgi:dihydroorotate dehydrogenase